jgi:hypothetical protein
MPAKSAALDRILEYAGSLDFEHEKRELESVLSTLTSHQELQEYIAKIRNRLTATVLQPVDVPMDDPNIQGMLEQNNTVVNGNKPSPVQP